MVDTQSKLSNSKFLSRNIQLFEGGCQFWLVKLLFGICIYIFVIEPILFKYFIKEVDLSFLDHQPVTGIIYGLITMSFLLFGIFHGRTKTYLFTFSGTLFLLLISYTLILKSIRYELYPSAGIKYVQIFYIAPFASLLAFLIYNRLEIGKNIANSWEKLINFAYNLDTEDETQSLPVEINLSHDLSLKDDAGEDRLEYLGLAKVILSAAMTVGSNKAFSIGINGSWGSGKSSLIDLLKEDLIPKFNHSKSQRKLRVLTISPWLYPDQESLISNFFLQWSHIIEDPFLKVAFDSYTTLLNDIKVGGMIIKLQNLLASTKSLEKIKKQIAYLLSKDSRYRYLIIIDDLDRLEKKEILDVARLTRVLADFPNTVYLLAYDRSYVDNLLKDNSNNKNTTYFDKIIQMEFKIPHITEEQLGTIFDELIHSNIEFLHSEEHPDSVADYDVKIITALKKVKGLEPFQHFLPTLRDVKRFTNGFLVKYSALRRKYPISFEKLIYLELLFYRYKDSYEKFYIAKERFTHYITQEALLLDVAKEIFISETVDLNKINSLLEFLFSNNDPNVNLEMIDYYYSYFGVKPTVTKSTVQYLLTKPKNIQVSEFENIILQNEGHKLVTFYLSHMIERAKEGQISFDDLRRALDIDLDIFSRTFLTNKTAFTSEIEEQLSNNFAERYNELQIYYNELAAAKGAPKSIEDSYMRLRSFTVYNEDITLPLSEDLKINLGSQHIPYPITDSFAPDPLKPVETFKQIDDCNYDKIFNSEKASFEFSFFPPDIMHWRLGFKFSKTNNFPLRAFRHYCGEYPIFHLYKHDGSDSGYIKATAYDQTGGRIEKVAAIDSVAFIGTELIKIRLSSEDNYLKIDLWYGDRLILNHSLFKGFYNFKISAWADNDPVNMEKPFSIGVSVKQLSKT